MDVISPSAKIGSPSAKQGATIRTGADKAYIKQSYKKKAYIKTTPVQSHGCEWSAQENAETGPKSAGADPHLEGAPVAPVRMDGAGTTDGLHVQAVRLATPVINALGCPNLKVQWEVTMQKLLDSGKSAKSISRVMEFLCETESSRRNTRAEPPIALLEHFDDYDNYLQGKNGATK
jgi:hypothetical protein